MNFSAVFVLAAILSVSNVSAEEGASCQEEDTNVCVGYKMPIDATAFVQESTGTVVKSTRRNFAAEDGLLKAAKVSDAEVDDALNGLFKRNKASWEGESLGKYKKMATQMSALVKSNKYSDASLKWVAAVNKGDMLQAMTIAFSEFENHEELSLEDHSPKQKASLAQTSAVAASYAYSSNELSEAAKLTSVRLNEVIEGWFAKHSFKSDAKKFEEHLKPKIGEPALLQWVKAIESDDFLGSRMAMKRLFPAPPKKEEAPAKTNGARYLSKW